MNGMLDTTGGAIAATLLGAAMGYVTATLVESFAHHHISDARPRRVRWWTQHPRLFKYLIRTHYSHHSVHHLRTFRKDHVTQFRNDDERRALDAELAERGAHGQIVLRSNYAVKLHGTGALVFVSPLIPFLPVVYLLLGPWGLVGSVLPMLCPPLFSNYLHPYLHMPHEVAVTKAPPLISWLLRTRYGRAVARNHFMHHRYMNCNFNLMLGGDILRGVSRRPSHKDIAEMQRIGLRLD
ncbi:MULTISPECIES: hypothetical protein [Sorangium]|uniref:Uncharacterized protein n=1 Tax=Sorangium cellulosum TaxID=56 RepID=A0A4P2QPS0_SORCE|nr:MULTISPECIES: hypothetical protein [Sorangium]AUX32159.1 hypothetical protein SOCE836_042950 [Sorangium cellulosum]WCQ91529.1 hypothetical protein NQZ70_04251 [Sorangium sp. Soce836]